jgi:hypothetical protein
VDTAKREELIRAYGPAHINLYAHGDCSEKLEQIILARGEVIDRDESRAVPSEELVGRFNDITHCDACGIEFKRGDPPYVLCVAMEAEELELWKKVRSET